MKRIFLLIFVILSMLSCREREYINDSVFCVYKNFIEPDTVPCSISNLTRRIDSLGNSSRNYISLNAYNYADKFNRTIFKVNDTLSKFLAEKYSEACREKELDLVGGDQYANSFPNMYHAKKYYFCGKIIMQPNINSLVFLNSNGRFNNNDLILFNFDRNKLVSLIKISTFARDFSEKSVELRTYIANKWLISITSPTNTWITPHLFTLGVSDNKLDFLRSEGSKKKIPFTYYIFRISLNGCVLLSPTDFDVKNIDLLGRECDYHKLRFAM